MQSLLPSLVALGTAALAALLLTIVRHTPPELDEARRRAARALALAVGAQAVHFAEEAFTGFNERLGIVLGLPGMSFGFFLVFNVAWLGLWVASISGVRSGRSAAFFAAWFLAIAGMFNGLAHPILAVASDGYFPGLISSPFVAAACIWLHRRLLAASRPRE